MPPAHASAQLVILHRNDIRLLPSTLTHTSGPADDQNRLRGKRFQVVGMARERCCTRISRGTEGADVSNRCCGRLLHRHASAMDVGAVKAPTIWRSHPWKRSRQLVSISPSRSFRFMAFDATQQYRYPPAASKRRYVLAFFQKLPPCLVGNQANGMAERLEFARPIMRRGAGFNRLVEREPAARSRPLTNLHPRFQLRALRRTARLSLSLFQIASIEI